jgi:D-lactate dehydrogenase
VADHFKAVEGLIKTGLRFGGLVNAVFGNRAMLRMTGMIRKILPSFPLWMSQLTGPLSVRPNQPAAPGAVYFVSCINRMMGKDMEKKDSIVEVFLRLSARAGTELLIASDIGGTCCGQAFSSKGFVPAYTLTVNRTIEKLWEWSHWGSLPVVMDISSCTQSLQGCRPYLTPGNQERYDRMRIFDSLEYLTEILLPRLTIKRKLRSAVFHPVCSLHKMGLYSNLLELATRTTEEPVIPFTAGCCGMAGDRGFYYPGLISSATRDQGAEAQAADAVEYYSTGKTCEMAMSEAVGQNYRSIVYLLDEVTAD